MTYLFSEELAARTLDLCEVCGDSFTSVDGHLCKVRLGERIAHFDDLLKGRLLFGSSGLFDFQKEGTRWLADRKVALLADDSGMGKTIQVLTALPDDACVVVVGQTINKIQWRNDMRHWRPDLSVVYLMSRGSFTWPEPGEVVIVGYSQLSDVLPDDCPPNVFLVADQVSLLQNPRTKRASRFSELSRAVRLQHGHVWLLMNTAWAAAGSILRLAGVEDYDRSNFGSDDLTLRRRLGDLDITARPRPLI